MSHGNSPSDRSSQCPHRSPLPPPSTPHAVPTASLCHPALPHTVACPETHRPVQNLGRRGQIQTHLQALREPGRIPHAAQGPQHHLQTDEDPPLKAQPWHPWTHLPTAPGSLCHPLLGPRLL